MQGGVDGKLPDQFLKRWQKAEHGSAPSAHFLSDRPRPTDKAASACVSTGASSCSPACSILLHRGDGVVPARSLISPVRSNAFDGQERTLRLPWSRRDRTSFQLAALLRQTLRCLFPS